MMPVSGFHFHGWPPRSARQAAAAAVGGPCGPLAPWHSLSHGAVPLICFAVCACNYPQLLRFGRFVLVWFFFLSCFGTCGAVLGDFRSLDRRYEALEGENERGDDPLQRGSSGLPVLAEPGIGAAASSPPPSHRPSIFPSAGWNLGTCRQVTRAWRPRMRRDRAGRGGARPGAALGGSGVCAHAFWGGRSCCACALGPAAGARRSAGWGGRGRPDLRPSVCLSVCECAVPPAPALSVPSGAGLLPAAAAAQERPASAASEPPR